MNACAECGALVPSGNTTLHALRCVKRALHTSAPPMLSKKQKLPDGAVIVQVLSDSDDDEQSSVLRQQQQSLSYDEKLARRLQEEEDEAAARHIQESEEHNPSSFLPPGLLLEGVLRPPSGGGSGMAMLLDALVAQEDARRIECEGPPCAADQRHVVTYRHEGMQERLQGGGMKWDASRPCVTCDDAEVERQLREVGASPPRAVCAANRALLQGLCAWRKHVVDTYLERRSIGEERWKRTGICTSEQCFLGRKGGVLCHVAAASAPITSLPSFVEAFPRDSKQRSGSGLSPGFAMLCLLFFDWSLDEACRDTVRGLLSKLSNKDEKARMQDTSHPWGMAFAAIEKLQRVDPRVKHLVLSRAHLP